MAPVISEDHPSFGWRVPAIWVGLLSLSCLTQTYVVIADEVRRGHTIGFGYAFALEASSHIAIGALVPALYWMQRRFPLTRPRNFIVLALAVVPFSVLHTVGMTALRLIWFSAILREPVTFPLNTDQFFYEFTKDIFTYCVMTAAIVTFRYRQNRASRIVDAGTSVPVSPPPAVGSVVRPQRFAVRKRSGAEVMVDVHDLDWVEASGNYAILHVGGETFEIRSSLTRLEGELDPKQFVRVHKSYLVNIERVTEVTPWVNGDWRIHLRDGAEVNLSRRYRHRFEALAPVRT